MAMTNAERQERYRNQQLGHHRRRLSAHISADSVDRLKRLGVYYGLTQGAMIDLALQQAESAVLERHRSPGGMEAYFNGCLRPDGTVLK